MANESNQNNTEIKDFFVRHGSKIVLGLILVLVVVAGVIHINDTRKAAAIEQAEILGKGYAFLYTNDKDKALAEFEGMINAGEVNGLSLAKAALFAGNIKYEKADFDGAIDLFQKSIDNAGSVVLVRSSALHGLASAKIEKGDFSAAAKLLEDFVKEFGKRTGDKEARFQQKEPIDQTPLVPDAMWKLVLVYQQQGSADKAKSTAERLLEVYGDNPMYAEKANKFLASL